MNNMEKQSAELMHALSSNNNGVFQEKFASFGGDYLNTKVREDSIAEKILDVRKVDENHPQMQRDLHSDTMYYYEEIEQDAIAMEVSMRADAKPYFVDGKVYTIPIGKIETESTKKPKMELRVAKNIVKFLRENNADAIRRTQDTIFMRTVRAGLALTGSVIGADVDDYTNYDTNESADWTGGPSKAELVNLLNSIHAKELNPARWLMSSTAYNALSAMDANEIGDLSGDMLSKGFSGDLLEMPIVKTIKTTLRDPLGTYGNHMFDHVDDNGNYFTDIYVFTEPSFLGHLIKVDDDAIWSEWRKDIFEWSSWRYCGLGFGDIRGMAMMRVQLQGDRTSE
jgi:hypothetical protein